MKTLSLGGRCATGLIVVLIATSCATGDTQSDVTPSQDTTVTTEAATTSASATTAATTTEAATTITLAADAAPPELVGRWQAEVGGDRVILNITATNYSFNTPGVGFGGQGKISVEGNQIRFYDAFPNPGDGFYEWNVDGDTLTFVALEPLDVAGGRRFGLVDRIWTRF